MANTERSESSTTLHYPLLTILTFLFLSVYTYAADINAAEKIPLYGEVLKDNKSIWVEPYHHKVEGIALSIGGGAVYMLPGGYSHMQTPYAFVPVVQGELYSPPQVPIVSRLAFASTLNTSYRGDYVNRRALPPTYFYGLLEIKLPLEWASVGHTSPIYVSYIKESQGVRSVISDTMNYRGEFTLRTNDKVYLSDSLDKVRVSVNTPITMEDAPYSFSRFGLYFSQLARPRYAFVKDGGYILHVREWDTGLFYEVSKPAFFHGFAVGLEAALGFGRRELLSNRAGIRSADFDSKAVQMALNALLEFKYNYKITENISIAFAAGYGIRSLTAMQSESSNNGRFNKSSASLGQAGITLTGSY